MQIEPEGDDQLMQSLMAGPFFAAALLARGLGLLAGRREAPAVEAV